MDEDEELSLSLLLSLSSEEELESLLSDEESLEEFPEAPLPSSASFALGVRGAAQSKDISEQKRVQLHASCCAFRVSAVESGSKQTKMFRKTRPVCSGYHQAQCQLLCHRLSSIL